MEADASQPQKRPALGPGHLELGSLVQCNPDVAFEVILEILHAPHGDTVTAILAAGPLENLIGYWGPTFIDRIEIEAMKNPAFRHLLGGVWYNGTPEVWQRIEAVRSEPW